MSFSFVKRILVVCALLCAVLCAVSCGGNDVQSGAVSGSDSVVSESDELPEEEIVIPIVYSEGGISDADFENGCGEYWRIDAAEGVVSMTDVCYEGGSALSIGAQEEYEAGVVQYISGLEPGYYYIEVYTLNEGDQDYCYVYGRGTAQGECMTAVPITTYNGVWNLVTVRGIEVGQDGILEVGIRACGSGQSAVFDSFSVKYENDQSRQYESLFGGAVSWLDWIEDLGGKYYYSDGTEGDALQIMAENGCNFVRLELYNNPGDYVDASGNTFPSGYKDADAIFDLAVRARDKGMKIQLSFMYSDYWGNEAIPVDWQEKIEGIGDNAQIAQILSECIYEYTKDYMQRLADAGIYPEYVSLGNEMNGGILLPYGCTYTTNAAMQAFCSFMDAGYRAVKEVSPESKIVLHIACNADDMFWESGIGTGRWFFGLCEKYGIKYDIIGTSYYPYWAQSSSQYALKRALDVNDFVDWCNMMIDYFDKDILVMESGINWGTPGQLSNNGAYKGIYSYTPEGQRDFMYELINGIKSVKDGRCIGDLYWDPVLVRQRGAGWAIVASTGLARDNCVETTTFFNYNHVALPVLNAYKYNVVGDDTAMLYGVVTDASGELLTEQSFTLTFCGDEYTVTTDRYGAYIIHVNAGSGQLSAEKGSCCELALDYGEKVKLDLTVGK